MTKRLSVLIALMLGSGLSLAAVAVNAQDAHPGAPPPGMAKDMDMGMDHRGPPHARFSPADRAAFFDAHLAGLHAGLKLTPDQEKLWPPVEEALRAGAKSAADRMEAAHNGPHPADAIGWLRKLSEEDIAKGETLKALADAAAPLYASLTDDQKHRLPFLLHGIRPHGLGAMAMGPGGPVGMAPGGDHDQGEHEPE